MSQLGSYHGSLSLPGVTMMRSRGLQCSDKSAVFYAAPWAQVRGEGAAGTEHCPKEGI